MCASRLLLFDCRLTLNMLFASVGMGGRGGERAKDQTADPHDLGARHLTVRTTYCSFVFVSFQGTRYTAVAPPLSFPMKPKKCGRAPCLGLLPPSERASGRASF